MSVDWNHIESVSTYYGIVIILIFLVAMCVCNGKD